MYNIQYNPARSRNLNAKICAEMNRLRRALETPEGERGTLQEGSSLNPSAISKSYIAARSGRENGDRYRVNHSRPKEDVAVSITLDISGSMSSRIYHREGSAQTRALNKFFGENTAFTEVAYSSASLIQAFHNAKMKARLSLVKPGNREYFVGPAEAVVKDWDQPWTDSLTRSLIGYDPGKGTCLTDYAWCAIDPLLSRKERHKIAIFMTDMADSNSSQQLDQLAKYALLNGIVLAGIGMDSNDSPRVQKAYNKCLPNAMHCTNADSFASSIVPFLIKSIRARQNGLI